MTGRPLTALLLLLLAACGGEAERGPLAIDVVAGSDAAERLLATNTAQGLVALDSAGEVTPALAQRWTVLDDGSFIFRLGDHRWDETSALSAGQVARTLREARRRDDAIAPLLAEIEEINPVTPRILELTFTRRRPDLLRLLALPELAVRRGDEGLGPLAISEGYAEADQRLLLVQRRAPPDPDERQEGEEPPPSIGPADTIEVRFSRPAMAVARFRRGETSLILGGDWTTLPYALAIGPQDTLVVDPVEGLFGLAFVEDGGFLADADNRQLLSLAINRDRLAESLARAEAQARASILPADIEGVSEAIAPPWSQAGIEARQRFAAERVGRWEAANGDVPPLRVALPDAAGSRVLFARLQADWRAVGIDAVRVDLEADAELRLVDRIAPSEHAEWYLQFFRCAAPFPCSEDYADAMEALAEAETPRVRAIRAFEAGRALEGAAPFIPLLRPIRWSLVSPGLAGFALNRFASHPLAPILAAHD